jgi:hypothetical protein
MTISAATEQSRVWCSSGTPEETFVQDMYVTRGALKTKMPQSLFNRQGNKAIDNPNQGTTHNITDLPIMLQRLEVVSNIENYLPLCKKNL